MFVKKNMTLVELIMVVCILLILAAIAIPRLNFRKDAQRGNCYGSADAIRSALSSYYAKSAISGTAAYPLTLSDPSFVAFLNADKLPKHPTGRIWDDYYSTQNNAAQYIFSTGKANASGACTGF